MAVALEHDRWTVSKSDFAVKVMIPDLDGFFGRIPKSRTLVIEPGTRALVIDDGLLIGEIVAGSYTLETFLERLQFWRKNRPRFFWCVRKTCRWKVGRTECHAWMVCASIFLTGGPCRSRTSCSSCTT